MGLVVEISMADEKIVRNEIDANWMHWLHIMSSQSLEDHPWLRTPFAARAESKIYQDDLNFWHLEMAWDAREPIRGFIKNNGELFEHRCVLWAVLRGERISEQIRRASEAHFTHSNVWPDYAWLKVLPKNVENGHVLNLEHCEVILLQADWVPQRFIAVGCAPSRFIR